MILRAFSLASSPRSQRGKIIEREYLEQAQEAIRAVQASTWPLEDLYDEIRDRDWRAFPHPYTTFTAKISNPFTLARCMKDHPALFDLIIGTCANDPR